jgi:glycosyltransferase involved in cell wall biosynthesis
MRDLSELNICFIAGTLGQGGAERQLFYILRALNQQGANVKLLCLTRGEFWEQKINELGLPVIWIGKQASKASRLSCLIKTLRHHRTDIIQSQHFYTNLYAVAASHLLGLNEIGAIRNDGISEVQANGSIYGRLNLRLPRILAANSSAGIRNAITLGVSADRLHLLPNVVDTDQFKPAPRRTKPVVTLMTVGRLEQQKRMDRFLTVLANLRKASAVPVQGIIVGDGSLRSQLENQALELGLLPDGVTFRGAVEDMTALYQEADILLLTSDWEGTPNVILEAMAMGLAIVATGVGGVPEIIQHQETGWITNVNDQQAMPEALLMLVKNQRTRIEMGDRARAFVLANHSPQILPKYLESLYQSTFSTRAKVS